MQLLELEYIVTPTSTTGTCTGLLYYNSNNPEAISYQQLHANICSGTGPNIALTATAPSSFTWTIGTITEV
jgi:hypothetical protein